MSDEELPRSSRSAGPPDPGGGTPRRRPFRPRLLMAAALAAAVLLVPPAVAFREQLHDLVAGEPAPAPVAAQFERWNLVQSLRTERYVAGRGWPADVDVGRAEGVLAVARGDLVATLWAAPVRDREGVCSLIVLAEAGGSPTTGLPNFLSCDPPGDPVSLVDRVEGHASCAYPETTIVYARLNGATSAELRLADGSAVPMEVESGHALAALDARSAPVAIVSRRAGGPSETSPVPGRPEVLDGTGCAHSWATGSRRGNRISITGSVAMGSAGGGARGAPPPRPRDWTGEAMGTIGELTETAIVLGLPTSSAPAWARWRCTRGRGSPSFDYEPGDRVHIRCEKGVLVSIEPWAPDNVATPAREGPPPRVRRP